MIMMIMMRCSFVLYEYFSGWSRAYTLGIDGIRGRFSGVQKWVSSSALVVSFPIAVLGLQLPPLIDTSIISE